MISGDVSDVIYRYLLGKSHGDRVVALASHDEVMRYLRLYAKDISEVSESKAIPKYCVGDVCFDTVSRRKQFESVYSGVCNVLREGEELPKPEYEVRFVVFDVLFCCFYGGDLRYSRMHLNNRIRVPEVGMGFYVFDEDIDVWADRVTKAYWDAESDRDCKARNADLDAGMCFDDDITDLYTGHINNDGSGNFYKHSGVDISKFVEGIRIRKVYRIKEE